MYNAVRVAIVEGVAVAFRRVRRKNNIGLDVKFRIVLRARVPRFVEYFPRIVHSGGSREVPRNEVARNDSTEVTCYSLKSRPIFRGEVARSLNAIGAATIDDVQPGLEARQTGTNEPEHDLQANCISRQEVGRRNFCFITRGLLHLHNSPYQRPINYFYQLSGPVRRFSIYSSSTGDPLFLYIFFVVLISTLRLFAASCSF